VLPTTRITLWIVQKNSKCLQILFKRIFFNFVPSFVFEIQGQLDFFFNGMMGQI
jgi:hypothetical protein